MDLENQKRVNEFSEKYGKENLVVLLGAAVYEEQISMMEMVLDVDNIIEEMAAISDQIWLVVKVP